MNKMYQRLKRKCISLVLFALLVAFIVPYYAYAADNGAEPAAAASAAESTGDFSMSESETSESETSEREETESSEEEEQQTRGRCRCISKYRGRCTGKYTRADINKKKRERLSVRICSLEEVMVFMLGVQRKMRHRDSLMNQEWQCRRKQRRKS
ncbi:MAG: hypothetical protein ACLVIY_12370 [Anaerobutyricum soehngenii]